MLCLIVFLWYVSTLDVLLKEINQKQHFCPLVVSGNSFERTKMDALNGLNSSKTLLKLVLEHGNTWRKIAARCLSLVQGPFEMELLELPEVAMVDVGPEDVLFNWEMGGWEEFDRMYLGGGCKDVLFLPRSLGKWCNLTHNFQLGWNNQLGTFLLFRGSCSCSLIGKNMDKSIGCSGWFSVAWFLMDFHSGKIWKTRPFWSDYFFSEAWFLEE